MKPRITMLICHHANDLMIRTDAAVVASLLAALAGAGI
jgi:hypothetical protein